MRKLFCFSLAWKLVLVFSMTAYGQVPQPPSAPQQPPSVVPALPMECSAGEERVYFARWHGATVNAVCFNPDSKQLRTAILFGDAPMVQRILPVPPLPGSGDLYAVSALGRAYKYSQYGYGRMDEKVRSWRTFGGYAYNPDPIHFYQYGYWWETSLSFRFPLEKEGVKFWWWGDGGSSNNLLKDDPRLGCVAVAELKAHEFCLDPQTETVFSSERTPFGTLWGRGQDYFTGRRPVNMVASPDGQKVYVSLSEKLGRIISLGYGGRAGDTLIEETVIFNINVTASWSQDRLAVSTNGLYFVVYTEGRGDTLWFYHLKTREFTKIVVDESGGIISGLAVAPAVGVTSMPTPPPGGGDKG